MPKSRCSSWQPRRAQTPHSFDVASIRPNHSGSTDSNVDSTAGGRLTVTNETLRELIKLAFSVKDYQISGTPGWIDSERYDIAAKTADQPSIFTAMQQQLGLRLESATGPVETLVIDHIQTPSEN